MTSTTKLENTVIRGGYCVGCGACAFAAPDAIKVELNRHGFFQAEVSEAESSYDGDLLQVCPFASGSDTEDDIADRIFGTDATRHAEVGTHLACYAGRVVDPSIYEASSSGGMARWMLAQLLKKGLVDAVVSVRGGEEGQPHQYAISRTPEEALSVSKSAYFPVEMSSVLEQIRLAPGRYVITGVPCFIKAVRNLCKTDTVLRERIVFTAGIVCGHLKSRYYAEMVGWQKGVAPADLARISFREKIPGRKASEYGMTASSKQNPEGMAPPSPTQSLFGTGYGLGFFKYKACDYCDDVLAETADIAFGDAWLPEFVSQGTSLVVVRNPQLAQIIEEAQQAGELSLVQISADQAAKTQAAGFRHRRQGLGYRLFLKERKGEWHPPKRVKPSSEMGQLYKAIFRYRGFLSTISVPVFALSKRLGMWSIFKLSMSAAALPYRAMTRVSHKLGARV